MTSYPVKGGPWNGRHVDRGDDEVFYVSLVEHTRANRYELWQGVWRHQGKRNVARNGLDMFPAVRVCEACHALVRKYEPVCLYCGEPK